MQALLNWVWQGTSVAAVVWLLIRVQGRNLNAATRERMWWMTLVGVAVIPLVHCVGAADIPTPTVIGDIPPTRRLAVSVPELGLFAIAAVWSAWTGISLIRLLIALVQLWWIRDAARPLDARREERLSTWRMLRERGRTAQLVVSDRVYRAAVVGAGRPLIVISPETLDRLSDDALDQVLVHEYGHVQRMDDVAILVQQFLVAIVGLHPAVWWINRELNIEREVACDDWVVAHIQAPKSYASCLVDLAERRRLSLSLSPGAAVSARQIAVRVARLLDRDRNSSIVRSRRVLMATAVAMVGLLVSAAALPLVEVVHSRAAERQGQPLSSTATFALLTQPFSVPVPRKEPDDAVPNPPTSTAVSLRKDARASSPSSLRPSYVASAVGPPPINLVAPVIESSDLGRLIASSVDPRPDRGPFPDDDSAAPGELGDAANEQPQPAVPAWRPAAEFGTAIGSKSRDMATKTSGFFSRLGKSIAGTF